MKKMNIQMGLLMAATLSFFLSLTGLLTAGKFTVPAFIISFLESFVISLIIGFFIPMKKLGDAAVNKAGIQPHSLKARLLETLLSDLIYTPFMTFVMVFMAHKQASKGGHPPPFIAMYGKSLIISLVVAYVIIFIVQPVFLKFVMKKNGIGGPPDMGGRGERPPQE